MHTSGDSRTASAFISEGHEGVKTATLSFKLNYLRMPSRLNPAEQACPPRSSASALGCPADSDPGALRNATVLRVFQADCRGRLLGSEEALVGLDSERIGATRSPSWRGSTWSPDPGPS